MDKAKKVKIELDMVIMMNRNIYSKINILTIDKIKAKV